MRYRPGMRRTGFTLIELMVVIVLLNVFFLLLAATLWGSIRIERADAAALDRLVTQSKLANQFRQDVAAAVAAPPSLNEQTAGPTCLILKMTEDEYVIYRWDPAGLGRTQWVGTESSRRTELIADEDVSMTFARSGAENGLILLRIVESRGRGESRREHPIEIASALGGDNR